MTAFPPDKSVSADSGQPVEASTAPGRQGAGRWTTSRKCRRVARVCSLLFMSLGLAALAGWAHWYSQGLPTPSPNDLIQPFLASLLADSNSMAISTAVLFLFLGTALLLQQARRSFPGSRALVIALVLISVAWSLAQFGEFAGDRRGKRDFEPAGWLASLFHEPALSPATVIGFLLTGTALFLIAVRPNRRGREVAAGCAAVVIAVNVVLLYGFFNSQQLFKDRLGAAVSFPTALAFVFLGTALLTAAGPRNFILRHLVGSSTTVVLVRTFLSITIGALLLSELIRSYLSRIADRDLRVILVGLWIYVVVVLVGVVVYWVASRVGSALDRARASSTNP